jgi:hypothetical protein
MFVTAHLAEAARLISEFRLKRNGEYPVLTVLESKLTLIILQTQPYTSVTSL